MMNRSQHGTRSDNAPVSPIREWLKKLHQQDIQDARDEIERLKRDGTWMSGVKIATPGELAQEIARLRMKLDEDSRKLERLQ